MQATVAKRTKPKATLKDTQKGKPHDLDSVLASVRALWEATDDADQDLREHLRSRILDDVSRLDRSVRTKLNLANLLRSRHKADAAQVRLFDEADADTPPERFPAPEVRVFVTDLSEQALELLPEAVRFNNAEEYRKFLVEKLSYNSISTRKRNAGYLVNRFFPGQYLHPDLTAFAAEVGKERLSDCAFLSHGTNGANSPVGGREGCLASTACRQRHSLKDA